MQSWCRTWPLNGSSRIRAKQKLLRKHKGACKSSWSRIGSLKSFTLTILWNLAKLVKIFPAIIARRHHTDRKQMRLLKELCAEWKKAPVQCCCNQVWMKIGGQIPWNVTPVCETSQICCLMGRRPMKDVLGNHLKDRSFRLVHWLSITLFLRRTSQEPVNLERKFYLDCSSDTLFTRGEFGRVTYWSQTLRVGDDGRIGNLLKKTQCERGDISQRRRIHFSSRRWTNQNPWRRSGTENITLVRHRPIQGESNIDFLGESEGSLPPPHDSLPDAGEAINDFWSMSGILIFRHHVEPRVKLYSPREESFSIPLFFWRIQNYSYESGCQAGETHRWSLEYRWITRLVWSLDRFHSIYSIRSETFRRIFVVQEETDKKAVNIQARSFMARTLKRNVKER